MRPLVLALPLAVIAFVATSSHVTAQESKSRGTLTAMAADSITVKVAQTEMKFAVDSKTVVEAPGGGTKSRAAQAAGQAGPKLSDVLKVGDPVEVSYTRREAARRRSERSALPDQAASPARTLPGP
jgi:hypothetical protein